MRRTTQSVVITLTLISMYLTLTVTLITGWVLNVIDVINSDFSTITGLLVARVIGIIVPPLGSVLGLFT